MPNWGVTQGLYPHWPEAQHLMKGLPLCHGGIPLLSESSPQNPLENPRCSIAPMSTGTQEEAFRQVRRIDPANGAALHSLGNMALKRGQWAEAERFFRQALTLHPSGSSGPSGGT